MVYLPILKNAHRYACHVFESFNFKQHYAKDNQEYISKGIKKVIILRDPIERWYSGIIQYMVAQKVLDKDYDLNIDFSNRDLCRMLTSVVVIDTHTKSQVNYLDGIDMDECIFIKFDSDLEKNLQNLCHVNFGGKFDPNLIEKLNFIPYFNNQGGLKKSDRVKDLTNKLKESVSYYGYESRLLEYYKKDIELYNNVIFLNTEDRDQIERKYD